MPSSPIRLATLLTLALLSLSALGTRPSLAQEPAPSHLAAARELITVTSALTTLDDLMPAFFSQVRSQIVTRPDLSKDLDQVLKSLEPEMEMQRQLIVTSIATSYTKYLSEAELREITAFFKSPIGTKYMKVQGGLENDVVNQVSGWADRMSEYVITRARAEMAKRGHQLQ